MDKMGEFSWTLLVNSRGQKSIKCAIKIILMGKLINLGQGGHCCQSRFKLVTEQQFRLEQKLLQWGLLVSDKIGGVVQTEND